MEETRPVRQFIGLCTPHESELMPHYRRRCPHGTCPATFFNNGNLELHLQKRHGIAPPTRATRAEGSKFLYHCPIDDCVYNAVQEKARHFDSVKKLRQHYQKVHAPKSHGCSECGRAFITPDQLAAHFASGCKRFICAECFLEYGSMEALVTHGKRKDHNIKEPQPEEAEPEPEKVAIPRLQAKKRTHAESTCSRPMEKLNQQTQTEPSDVVEPPPPPPPKRAVSDMAVQTDIITVSNSNGFSADLDDIQSLLRSIETQTEPSGASSSLPCTSSSIYNIDQMFSGAQSSHMHTQTCEELLTELGLAADIQTQTTGGDGGGGAHDELLVSTETQTSFTQCLLDSCNATDAAAFGSLSQHTQTCETLGGFLFGGHDTDFIAGLQSTYTQT